MPPRPHRILAVTLLCIAVVLVSRAEAAEDRVDLVGATLVADHDAVTPGQVFMLGVHLKIKPHWHTYWINPGETGDATKITLTGPDGFTFGPIQWPLPSTINAPGGISYGYENEVLLMIPVTVSKDVSVGQPVTVTAKVAWLVCMETCIKGGTELNLSLPVGAAGKPANADLFDTWKRRVPVPHDASSVRNDISSIDQPTSADGSRTPSLAVRWTKSPRKVEWFPVSTRAVAVDKVVVKHDGQTTRIQFQPTVYKPEQLPDGRVESVLVYEDAAGEQHGVAVPVYVRASK